MTEPVKRSVRPNRPLRRLLATLAVGAVSALVLAGCVSIPSSGGVNEGPQVQAGGGGGSYVDLPQGPPRNASKEEILVDFLQAETSSLNGYQVARSFLTAKASQTWDPTKSVLIREKPTTPVDLGNNTLDYTVSTNASVNSLGVYSEQSTNSDESLSYTFSKVKGQWRINGLPDGIILSRESFENSFGEYPVYFFDPDFRYLVPDVRFFPTGTTVPNRIVAALLAGPSDWLQQGVVTTAFPAGVSVGSPVVIRNNSAVVDFSAGAASTKPLERARMYQQLQTSMQNENLSTITMTAHGAPLAVTDQSAANQQVVASVNSSPLLLKGKQFGFFPRLDSFGSLSTQVVSLAPSAIVLDRSQSTAAVLTGTGIYRVTGSGQPKLVDSRAGLIAPSIDPSGYVWSVPSTDASAIVATGSDGIPHAVSSTIPARSTIVSLDVSHDGTRVLMYLATSAGPELIVAGIIRHDGVPVSLGQMLQVPVSSQQPVDATWVDAETVAALTVSSGTDTVTTYVVGGSAGETSTTEDAVHLVGAQTVDSLRVITATGEVQELRASGWQDIGVVASVLATQQ